MVIVAVKLSGGILAEQLQLMEEKLVAAFSVYGLVTLSGGVLAE